jgi:peptidoglycan hydrolase CwlO-like protein
MDWTNIITQLIETGGIVGVLAFFLTSTEKKANAQLVNMQRMYDNLLNLYDKLQARYDVETDKVGKLYDQISKKNEQIDELNTKVAISELKRCDCIACAKRQPPMGDKWKVGEEE